MSVPDPRKVGSENDSDSDRDTSAEDLQSSEASQKPDESEE